MACILRQKSPVSVSKGLSEKFGKLWLGAEVILFVLVGTAVDIRYTLDAGLPAVAMIFLSLLFRCLGVALCMAGTSLNPKERLFCIIAYLPKATVQAAIGSIPLTLGLPCGKNRPFCSGAGNSYYCPTWSHWDGPRLQKAPVPVTEASICRDYCSP